MLAIVAVAACASGPAPTMVPDTPTKKPSYTLAPPTPVLSPVGTPPAAAHGRPYSSDELAAAIQQSRDIPPQLKTPARTRALAEALAGSIWTYDGNRYLELILTASCDEGANLRCDVGATGVPAFVSSRDRSDHYGWVATAIGVTASGGNGLAGYPSQLDSILDRLARSLDNGHQLQNLTLIRGEWAIRPGPDVYVLHYSDGGEEGGTRLLVTIDRAAQRILMIVRQP